VCSNNIFGSSSERIDQRATNCCCWRNIQKHRPLGGRDRSSAQTAGYQLENPDQIRTYRSSTASCLLLHGRLLLVTFS
ncbi:hypothetical protein AMECASPLE_034986, partial [Ameca splendens]